MELGKEILKRISNEFTWQKSGEGEFPPHHTFLPAIENRPKLTCNRRKYVDVALWSQYLLCTGAGEGKTSYSLVLFLALIYTEVPFTYRKRNFTYRLKHIPQITYSIALLLFIHLCKMYEDPISY
jgi:hypothetical protein